MIVSRRVCSYFEHSTIKVIVLKLFSIQYDIEIILGMVNYFLHFSWHPFLMLVSFIGFFVSRCTLTFSHCFSSLSYQFMLLNFIVITVIGVGIND